MNDEDRIWYCIKGYNGYELSNDGLLRSMKNFKKNPQGKLIKKYKDKIGYYYYLTNDNNDRVKIYEDHIKRIVRDDRSKIRRRTEDTDIASRNKLAPSQRKKKQNYIGIPKFTIIDESLYNYKPKKNAIYFY